MELTLQACRVVAVFWSKLGSPCVRIASIHCWSARPAASTAVTSTSADQAERLADPAQAALLALLTISLSGSAAAQASVSVRNSCDSAANSVAMDFTVVFFVEAAGEYFTACSAYGKPENGTFLCILTTRVPPGAAQVLGQTVSAVWSAAASVSGQPGCLRHLQGSKKTGGRYKKVTATGLKDCTAGQPHCLFFEEVGADNPFLAWPHRRWRHQRRITLLGCRPCL